MVKRNSNLELIDLFVMEMLTPIIHRNLAPVTTCLHLSIWSMDPRNSVFTLYKVYIICYYVLYLMLVWFNMQSFFSYTCKMIRLILIVLKYFRTLLTTRPHLFHV